MHLSELPCSSGLTRDSPLGLDELVQQVAPPIGQGVWLPGPRKFQSSGAATYDRRVSKRPAGPALVKARGLPLLRTRSVELWQGVDYRWRELLESADVMSEGAVRHEPDGLVYYGSTSLLLPFVSHGGQVPDQQADRLAGALSRDPHVRLRVMRIARREAEQRSPGPLARVTAEVFVRRERRGLKLDVEVEARVIEQGVRRARSGTSSRRAASSRPGRR